MSKYRIKRVTEKNTLGETVSDNFIIEKKILWWWSNSTATTLYVGDNSGCFYNDTLSFNKLEDAQNFKEYLEGKKSFYYKDRLIEKYFDVNSWRLGHGNNYLYILTDSIKYSHSSFSTFKATIKKDIKELQYHIDKTTVKKIVNYNVELEAEAERYNL